MAKLTRLRCWKFDFDWRKLTAESLTKQKVVFSNAKLCPIFWTHDIWQIKWYFAHKPIRQLIGDGMKPNWGTEGQNLAKQIGKSYCPILYYYTYRFTSYQYQDARRVGFVDGLIVIFETINILRVSPVNSYSVPFSVFEPEILQFWPNIWPATN